MPESRSLKLQKKYLSSAAWGTVSLTNMLTLTFQNQKWRDDTWKEREAGKNISAFICNLRPDSWNWDGISTGKHTTAVGAHTQ